MLSGATLKICYAPFCQVTYLTIDPKPAVWELAGNVTSTNPREEESGVIHQKTRGLAAWHQPKLTSTFSAEFNTPQLC